VKTTRIEAQLEASVSADSSCSVYWLIPDATPEELHEAMSALASRTAMTPWGFLGWWDQTTKLDAHAADIDQAGHLSGHYSIGDTRTTGSILELPLLSNSWFWQLVAELRQNQICAALMPPGSQFPGGWTYAGLQLVLSEAARQVRPGRATHDYVLRALTQAFLAETVLAGGIAVTRLQAELLRPGLALTGTSKSIDEAAAEFQDFQQADPIKVERSVFLGGNW
jgi:hypothetical protein